MPSACKEEKRKKKSLFAEINNGFKPRLAAAFVTSYAQIIFFKSFTSEFIRHSSPANHSVTVICIRFKTNKRRWSLIPE